ncbi:MAG: peptidase MA family metallohydrolase [Anaerolineales bacterium]|nr:peptidase MA family metallohydrolase [Anaerolineales bacterium]
MAAFCLAALTILPALSPLKIAAQESPITFSGTEVENNFPFWSVFRATSATNAGEIVSAKFVFKYRNATSSNLTVLDIVPGPEADLEYRWDTSNITVPPSTPIYYYWEVADSQGNRQKSEEELFLYHDQRFEWQVLERENLSVWWHDQPPEFGEEVMDIAILALQEQVDLFMFELDFPIYLIIYNDFDEFAEWHSHIGEFVGGQAFPPFGVTTQIVPADGNQRYWLNDVIPHEISHLFFYQATFHPLSFPPTWLDEGVAQYNELTGNMSALDRVRSEAALGNLLRLTSLTGSFGQDPDQVRLSYDEGLSAVAYMVDAYGEEGMSRLLGEYREGNNGDSAFENAFGRTIIEFEQDWLASMGIPPGMYPTITPTAGYTPPPSPTALSLPTKVPSRTPTATEAEATSSPPSATAQFSSTPRPTATVEPSSSAFGGVLSICGSAVLMMGLMAGAPAYLRRKIPRSSGS